MRDLRLQLDDTDFARLIETARALIPTLAPAWTDHNIHDPGITLLDLTSWTAEAQIYSLARLRRDERVAYAGLVGVQPSGPLAATGMIWPAVLPANGSVAGRSLPAGTRIRSERANTPDVSLRHATYFTGARLTRLTATLAGGELRDWTRINQQEAASFAAFGEVDTGQAVLTLHFSGALADTEIGEHRLSLGVRIADSALGEPSTTTQGVEATLHAQRRRQVLPVALDTTGALLRSGVLLLDLSAVDPGVRDFTITLRSRGGDFARAPRLLRIAPNVLLVAGRQSVQEEAARWGTGLPDQSYLLGQPGLQFGAALAAPVVQITQGSEFATWLAVDDLSSRGPSEQVYVLDAARATLRFGNGINGAVPPAAATLRVSYSVSSGALGNVPRGVSWRVPGVAGVFGQNSDALSGGSDASSLEGLQRNARTTIRSGFPLVTAADLEQAALALADLRVARARELASDAQVCGFPELAGVRTLAAVAARPADAASDVLLENASWLLEIQRRLAPRLPLGQRLQVVAPRYLSVRVRVTLRARAQVDPVRLQRLVESELRRRCNLTVSRAGDSEWPFERDVKRLDVQGWLQKLPGVAQLIALELLLDDVPVRDGSIPIRGRALPRLRLRPDDVVIERTGTAVRS